MIRKSQIVILLLASVLSGCSIHQTFFDKNNDPDQTHGPWGYKSKVYIGVKKDFAVISNCFSAWWLITCPFALLATIDLPFSFVADTIFLPYTLPKDAQNKKLMDSCIENKRKLAAEAQKYGNNWKDDDIWCVKYSNQL